MPKARDIIITTIQSYDDWDDLKQDDIEARFRDVLKPSLSYTTKFQRMSTIRSQLKKLGVTFVVPEELTHQYWEHTQEKSLDVKVSKFTKSQVRTLVEHITPKELTDADWLLYQRFGGDLRVEELRDSGLNVRLVHNFLYLILRSGSRMAELFTYKMSGDGSLLRKNLKWRQNGHEKQQMVIVRIAGDRKLFLKTYNALKPYLEFGTDVGTWERRLNRYFTKYIKSIGMKYEGGTHLLRKLYGSIVVARDYGEKPNQITALKRVLGHKSEGSTIHYRVDIQDDEKIAVPEGGKTKCLVCNSIVKNFKTHQRTAKHQRALSNRSISQLLK